MRSSLSRCGKGESDETHDEAADNKAIDSKAIETASEAAAEARADRHRDSGPDSGAAREAEGDLQGRRGLRPGPPGVHRHPEAGGHTEAAAVATCPQACGHA